MATRPSSGERPLLLCLAALAIVCGAAAAAAANSIDLTGAEIVAASPAVIDVRAGALHVVSGVLGGTVTRFRVLLPSAEDGVALVRERRAAGAEALHVLRVFGSVCGPRAAACEMAPSAVSHDFEGARGTAALLLRGARGVPT